MNWHTISPGLMANVISCVNDIDLLEDQPPLIPIVRSLKFIPIVASTLQVSPIITVPPIVTVIFEVLSGSQFDTGFPTIN